MKTKKSAASAHPKTAPAAVRLGFIALVDCLPLLAAAELGFFEKHGVKVELSREVGWATIREKILYRQLDAAHAVGGLALSLRLGLEGAACPALAPFVFNRHGNAITLGMDLWRRGVRDAATLQKLVRSTPQRLYTFGITARSASHHFLMRRWLMSGGIDPERDVRIVMLPPTLMAGSLRAGLLDGYCAGEPWNSTAVATGSGWCPAVSESLAPRHPEKILLTTEDFAAERHGSLHALIRALHDACAWCDRRENRTRAVEILHASGCFHQERDLLRTSLVGPFHNGTGGELDAAQFHIFHRDEANVPSRQDARWLTDEFITHGLLPAARRAEAQDALAACWNDSHLRAALSSPTKPNSKNHHQPKPSPAHS